MLFMSYWELNENMPAAERLAIAQKLTRSGTFPGKGVKILRWDITPDMWGVTLLEADSAEAVEQFIGIWRLAGAGFFKTTRTAPVTPVPEMVQRSAEILATLR